jgi:type I restriction enzyme, S subunit
MTFEWSEALTIGALLARDGGSIKTGPFGTALKASEYSEHGVPLISVREIGHGSFHIDGKTPRVNEETISRLPEYVLNEGDVVFARKGGIERCALVRRHQSGWFLGSDGIRLRPPKTCDARFVAYSLQTKAVKDWLIQHSTGSTMASLNQATISRLPITLPSRHDQTRVADMLETLDDRITLLRETSATLESIGQALFKSWFVDFDPVRAKQEGRVPEGIDEATVPLFPDGFEESELGLAPRGWQPQRLESFLELRYGKALKATDRLAGDVPVYGSGGVTGRHNKALVSGPSIVVGRKGTVGSLYWEDVPFFPIDTVFYVESKVPLTYCYYMLQTLGLSDMNTDAAVPGLNRDNVYRLKVTFPNPDVIKVFDEVVKTLRTRIFEGKQHSECLVGIRDSLLPRLISGQLRLSEAEALVA